MAGCIRQKVAPLLGPQFKRGIGRKLRTRCRSRSAGGIIRRREKEERRVSRSYFLRPLFLDVKLHLPGQTCWAGGTELVRSITHCPGKICRMLTQSWELECGFCRSCTFLHIDCMGMGYAGPGWGTFGVARTSYLSQLICHCGSV